MSYKVSVFKNVNDNIPKSYDLDKWLKLTIKPSARLLNLVNRYKDSLDKADKEKIPCITVSSSFTNKRNLQNIENKLPFICLDVDRYSKSKKKASNDCVDMLLVKEMFMNHPSCYYCGHSLSGDNVYAIMHIYNPEKLDKYFAYFEKKLSLRGINIDASCKDYTRLRFFSHDPEAFYNPEAKPLRIEKIAAKGGANEGQKEYAKSQGYIDNEQKVDKIIGEIKKYSIDITSVYEDWIKIAGALNSEFGENGRDFFHAISQFHPDYEFKKCDLKYDQCRKMNKTSLGSLFKIASDYGVRY